MAHKEEIDASVARVLSRGRYILGDEVCAFEDEFSRYVGVSSGIGVGSGTEALHVALAACGVGTGDEVVTVSHTATATISAIRLTGAAPVFVDIDPEYFTMDPSKIETAITKKTKAIIPVHLYGQSADMAHILSIAKKYKLKVIEDCAQAHGAVYMGKRAGSFGDMACFSFYPTKNLGALGDGGMVVTNKAVLAKRARLLHEYGWKKRFVSGAAGWNTRLDELQAAVLRVKLRFLDTENSRRSALAKLYTEELSPLKGIMVPKARGRCTHVYHQYVIRTRKRDALKKFLEKHEIQTIVHYPIPVHHQPYYKKWAPPGRLSETEKAARAILSLPVYPELAGEKVHTVCKSIQEFYN